jgi:opacity protein-like surface antigen
MISKKHLMNTTFYAICSVVILYTPSAFAHYMSEHNYYLGGGLGYEQINFKSGYGGDFFPDSIADFELFLGSQHDDRFGFEVGVSATPDKSRDTLLNSGQAYPGNPFPLPAGAWEIWRPYYNTQAIFAGINRGYSINEAKSFKVYGFAGLAATQIRTHINFVNDDLPGDPSLEHIAAARRDYNATRIIPIVKFGVEYKHNNWGLRMSYAWKYYAAFHGIKSKQNPTGNAELRMNNVNGVYLDLLLFI